jgi:phosphohistidine phosphatase
MMDLILWRHAEAEDGFPDADRALTEKGQRQAALMANFLSSRLPSNTRILVSPARRTQQTVRALTEHFITEPAINTGANATTILEKIDWPNAGNAVLLVGHQPWLGEIAAQVMTDQTAYWQIKKGSVWWFRRRDQQTNLRLVIAPEHL